jgi:5'-nucleotidase
MPRNLVAGPTQEEIIIFDNDNFLNKLRMFIQHGSEHVEVVSDFDMTFSRYKTNGVKGVSTFQLIQASVLSPEHASYVKSLYERYHPIEIDPNVPLDLKEKLMRDWWEKSNDILLQEGFLETNMVDYVFSSTHYFRYGLPEFLNKCYEKLTPITIVSGGLGNLIDASLQQIVPCHNINVISNYIQFDSTGKSVCFRHPGVSANKSSVLAGQKVRRNVIVIGDLPSVNII